MMKNPVGGWKRSEVFLCHWVYPDLPPLLIYRFWQKMKNVTANDPQNQFIMGYCSKNREQSEFNWIESNFWPLQNHSFSILEKVCIWLWNWMNIFVKNWMSKIIYLFIRFQYSSNIRRQNNADLRNVIYQIIKENWNCRKYIKKKQRQQGTFRW